MTMHHDVASIAFRVQTLEVLLLLQLQLKTENSCIAEAVNFLFSRL